MRYKTKIFYLPDHQQNMSILCIRTSHTKKMATSLESQKSKPRHPPNIHLPKIFVCNCFSNQATSLTFYCKWQRWCCSNTNYYPLQPCFNITDSPLQILKRTSLMIHLQLHKRFSSQLEMFRPKPQSKQTHSRIYIHIFEVIWYTYCLMLFNITYQAINFAKDGSSNKVENAPKSVPPIKPHITVPGRKTKGIYAQCRRYM